MKKLLFLLFAIILVSCSQRISNKDLEGRWSFSFHNNNTPFITDFIINKDSVQVIDYLNFSFQGTYTIKKDSILFFLKDPLSYKITLNKKDSSITLDNNVYHFNQEEIDYQRNYNLMDLDSEIKMTADSLTQYLKTFDLVWRDNNLILEDYSGIQDILMKLSSINVPHNGPYIYNILLNKNINLTDLKTIFLKINLMYNWKVNVITKVNLKDNNYSTFPILAHVWQDEIRKFAKNINISPRIPEDDFRKNRNTYIKDSKPLLLEIKSKEDFTKLNSIKANSHYLVSINLDLPIEDFLNLNQEINSIRKNKKTRIRTELINF